MDMKRVHQILFESFTKTIKEYKDICNLLDPLIKKFWKKYREEWKYFAGWKFSENGEYIIVNYSYFDYTDEWEFDQDNIPINKIIEMIEWDQGIKQITYLDIV